MLPSLASAEECTGCLVCADGCSCRAITAGYNTEGFLSPLVNEKKCSGCGNCEKICPVIDGYSYRRSESFLSIPYAAWSENDQFRIRSASGGAFYELAKVILEESGIVTGAIIDGMGVKHIAVDNIGDLHKLQGSKYLQSDTSGIYSKTYDYLLAGKTVLFSGTPCQVGGVQSFLHSKTYPGRLYTVDVACRGVPSGLILDAYNKHTGNRLKEIKHFRDKRESWLTSVRPQNCVIVGENDESTDAGEFYMNVFLNDLALRKSCYNCKFAHFERKSDITLADFWFIREHPEQHKKGVSLLITNSIQGKELLERSGLSRRKTTWGRSNIWYNSRIFRGINTLGKHPVRQFMPLLMKNTDFDGLNRLFALQNCDGDPRWKAYKEAHRECVYNDYLQNREAYFDLMLEKGTFVNILSFQMAFSYGSVLQSYALKQVIERLGYDVRHINLKADSTETAFDWSYEGAQRLRKSFDGFRKMHFPHSLNLYGDNNVMLKFNSSDMFVAGSDQIWNPVYSDRYWREFFLNFVPDENKKIAYAASFGTKNTDKKLRNEIKSYLQRFDSVSCREKEGVGLCRDIFGVDACNVLDPCLLDVDYSTLFNPEKFRTETPELLFFGLGQDRAKQYPWIKYIAKQQGLDTRVINGPPVDEEINYSHYVDIEEWLSRLYNSSIIVTNSYHTLIFAIIFKKNFIIIPRFVEKDNECMEFSRFDSLLSQLELNNRYFSSLDEIKRDHRWVNNIDYDKVYERLEKLKTASLIFLKNALKKD